MTLDLNLVAVLPVLAPLVAAVLVLLLDAAVPGGRDGHLTVAAGGLVAGALGTVPGLGLGAGDVRGALCLPDGGPCLYVADRLTSTLQLAALLAALVVLVLTWRDWADPGDGSDRTGRTPVVAALLLGATGGVVAVPAAGDLGTLLVSLELATLPTVALVALVRTTWADERRARAVEGAVALLTTSLVSFALLALGAALWVAATGTALLGAAGGAAGSVDHPPLLVLAAVLLVAGLAFKVSAVPFHAWTPVTYAAAPLPVTAYLATVSKVAALGALVVVVRALGAVDGTTLVAVAVLAAASMTLGNLVALTQSDTVRLLAWSTVAQAGWVLLPLVSLSSRAAHAAGSYLLVYVVATLLAFVVVAAVARSRGSGGTALEEHRGLLRSRPLLALPLALALLTLAGLPPGIAGVVAKIVALRPVLGGGSEWLWLALVAAGNIALGIAVYLRWLAVVVGAPAAVGRRGDGDTQGDPDAGEARHTPVPVAVLVGLLTAVLVAGSVMPLGIV
ncbi:proton-conducting transporter membrane subunit [Ornithinimicrobium flavum]|uniref:proton-conducting transporter transmembrane domain-containing protein n=1 Tax=Ornithinimicrobium flavum TaxID=1288636 RepID=UPI00106F7899|nr:proton-conducting transporter membrane subunit [Ornithinimicrobium flavum]